MNRTSDALLRQCFNALICSLAAATLIAVSGGCAVAATTEVPSGSVTLFIKATPQELGTSAGAKRLALRIRNAAAEACGRDLPSTMRTSDGFIRCREDAINETVSNLGSPLVAAALGRSPQTLARSSR